MPNSPIFAVLDVGSNSVRLLVGQWAQGRPVPLHTQKITTRLLSGMAGGLLSPASIRRTAQAIAQLADQARAMGAAQVEGFGTSAMRDGGNRDALIALARHAGVELRVLSGEEEAGLAYAGAAPQGRRGVVDIGGGSTELLAGKDGAPLAAYSARMGAVRLAEALGGDLRPGPHAGPCPPGPGPRLGRRSLLPRGGLGRGVGAPLPPWPPWIWPWSLTTRTRSKAIP